MTTADKLESTFAPKGNSGLDIDNMFTRHTPTPEQLKDMEHVRFHAMKLALCINVCSPVGPNQTLAIRHLEDALMRANKAITEGK